VAKERSAISPQRAVGFISAYRCLYLVTPPSTLRSEVIAALLNQQDCYSAKDFYRGRAALTQIVRWDFFISRYEGN